jgi:hypothetical protein
MLPADGKTLSNFNEFKFYVAGGITNLTPVSTQAYDINGMEMAGVVPSITYHDIMITTTN